MSKKCIIVHGCPSYYKRGKAMNPNTRTYDKHWIPWLKQKLEEGGVLVETPMMPRPWYPVYEDFKRELEKIEVDENTILVGHSCGGTFLVRWLGESKKRILKLILVAPWKFPTQSEVSKYTEKFYDYFIDESIKERVGKIYMFTSNNEHPNGKKSLEVFYEALGGEVVNLDGHGHYVEKDMGTEEFPELLEKIME